MVKRPKDWTLDILGKRFAVKWRTIPGKDFGQCHSQKCELWVDHTVHLDQQKDTFLHESLHALDHEMDTNLRERQIRLMATGILHFLRANPEAVRWLMQS